MQILFASLRATRVPLILAYYETRLFWTGASPAASPLITACATPPQGSFPSTVDGMASLSLGAAAAGGGVPAYAAPAAAAAVVRGADWVLPSEFVEIPQLPLVLVFDLNTMRTCLVLLVSIVICAFFICVSRPYISFWYPVGGASLHQV